VKEEGWTKDGLSKMYKLDSYFRESQRIHFLSTRKDFYVYCACDTSLTAHSKVPVGRTTLADFTFSDGLCIPKGTSIGINVYSRHLDEKYYQDAGEFDPFRHVRDDGEGQPLVTGPAVDYHPFGHGRAAWCVCFRCRDHSLLLMQTPMFVVANSPGRFFAATELKLMMAHLITNYDFRLEKDEYPRKLIIESQSVPNYSVKVLFRKRAE
jgi:hypothetical protein